MPGAACRRHARNRQAAIEADNGLKRNTAQVTDLAGQVQKGELKKFPQPSEAWLRRAARPVISVLLGGLLHRM